MTISIAISIIAVFVSVVSVFSGIYFNSKNSKHTNTKDSEQQMKEKIEEIKERTRENAVINSKLDLITSSNQEIKEQISSLVKKVDAHGDEIIKIEENLKSVWERIKLIEQTINKEDDK